MNTENIFAVTLIAADRPGIVAGVSKVFYENNFNIEDSSSTLLQGFFSAIFIVKCKEGRTSEQVKELFSDFEKAMEVDVLVQEIAEPVEKPEGEHYVVSVYGSDKPGIVNKIAEYLSEKKINIMDLQTKVAGSKTSPIYIMVLEVIVESGADVGDWEGDLKKISRELGTDVNIRHIETYEF
ncbi:amino acid-binding ACT domain protein [Denitrovibrio acetiphilus DSM 12809]|uniref:Amino acid-binding ACT domain protein n=1 Tax=Denitrovibrio acetiphilus (strain DSM 12809 / NBRC 114555 / N2460) TaxID=522772 RepID=D4H303_DENA2|nr:ACT domain-containing protein [Denitrovibrio acetiphilus]ADD69026.1 amino acid-binding ACT domain protein [Denitrovibrio acetiphilus DSM 12809]